MTTLVASSFSYVEHQLTGHWGVAHPLERSARERMRAGMVLTDHNSTYIAVMLRQRRYYLIYKNEFLDTSQYVCMFAIHFVSF